MSEQNDGGPAFPPLTGPGNIAYTYGGMTLRDYFAAKAMQGLCSEAFRYMQGEGHASDKALDVMIDIGVVSYRVADAMLAEREDIHHD